MVACLKSWSLITNNGVVVMLTNTSIGGGVSNTQATVLVPDKSGTAIADCEAVSISGADYAALKAGAGSSGSVQTPTPQNWLELGNMSVADAQVISGYVGLLWAGVWGIKQVIKSLSISERNQDE